MVRHVGLLPTVAAGFLIADTRSQVVPAGGQPWGTQLWAALAWCGGILTVSVLLSMVLFRRRTA